MSTSRTVTSNEMNAEDVKLQLLQFSDVQMRAENPAICSLTQIFCQTPGAGFPQTQVQNRSEQHVQLEQTVVGTPQDFLSPEEDVVDQTGPDWTRLDQTGVQVYPEVLLKD